MSRCPNCMNELTDRNCSNCGYPLVELASVKDALPVGTQLNNRYELGNALGKNIQSIAYIAYDAVQANPVIILEFYPKSVVTRKFNDVIIRGSRDLYVEACRLYLTSDKVQPLMKLDSFAENNTVYRVYQLNGHSAQAIEEAEVLLDDPILFRNNIGKPVMSINALAIPQMPRTRAWSLSKRIQGEKKRRAIRNMLVAAVAVTIVALLGFFVYDMFRMHEVTIVVQSHADIKRASFGDQVLPEATIDPETNLISYKVNVRKGEYIFTAETEDDVRSGEEKVSVNKAQRYEIVMPTPKPTPEPTFSIQAGQWLIQENGKYWIVDEKSGEKTEPTGKPQNINIVEIKVTADLNALLKRESAKLIIRRGEAQHALTFKGKSAYATVSDGEYALCLDDGNSIHELMKVNAACDYRAELDENAIEFYLENLRDYDKTKPVIFVADECSQPDFVTEAEELNEWADLYPKLFNDVRQHALTVKVDSALKNAKIKIEGKVWEQGDPVTISSNTDKLKVEFDLAGIEENEDDIEYVSVSADMGTVIIGSEVAGKRMEDHWTETEKYIEVDGVYHLFMKDGNKRRITEQTDKKKFEDALKLFEEDFDEKVRTKKTLNLAFDPTVNLDYIKAVTLDGIEIDKKNLSARVTTGTYELEITFTNGLDSVTMQIDTNNIPRQKLLADQRMKLVQFANNAMEQQKVYGAVEIGGEYYYLPVEANAALEEMDAETYIRYTQVYEEALDKAPWVFAAVDIYVDERIDADLINEIEVAGITVPRDTIDNGAYARIRATIHDNYKVAVALEGNDERINERKKAEEKPETESNEWHLLGEMAEEKQKRLSFWGTEAEKIELLDGDSEYLTQEAVDKAKAGATLYKLTVRGAKQEDWLSGYKYVVKYAKDNADAETEPLEPVVTEDGEFSVIMTQGNYAIYAAEKEGEKEFLLAEAEMHENVEINLDEDNYGEMIEALATPTPSPTPSPEPTPTPTPKPYKPDKTKKPNTTTVKPTTETPTTATPTTATPTPEPPTPATPTTEPPTPATPTPEPPTPATPTTEPPTPATPTPEPTKCDPNKHSYGEGELKIEPTCTSEGMNIFTCKVCGDTKQETVKKVDHKWVVNPETIIETKCTEKGHVEKTCAICKTEIKEDVSALGHNFVNGKCKRCGENEQ